MYRKRTKNKMIKKGTSKKGQYMINISGEVIKAAVLRDVQQYNECLLL